MATSKELEQQVQQLLIQAEQQRKIEASTAIDQIKALVATYHIKASDIFPDAAKATKEVINSAVKKAPIKYRDPLSGKTWSGRGLAPLWIKDKNRDDFLV